MVCFSYLFDVFEYEFRFHGVFLDDVVVIEAMKMENLLKSTETGIVKEVLVSAGETVAADQPLIRLADQADSE